jgi:hypothetical protein
VLPFLERPNSFTPKKVPLIYEKMLANISAFFLSPGQQQKWPNTSKQPICTDLMAASSSFPFPAVYKN